MSENDWSSSLTSISPGFIQKYFESSRLHHLSTWKADLCDYVNDKMSCGSLNYEVIDNVSHFGDNFRTILHIDMDCFFASVSMRDKPHLKEFPVAVAHSTRGASMDYSSSEIASCNYLARSKGVRNGTFIGSAKKLCPDLVIVPYEFDKYDEVSKQLYTVLIRHADFVQAVSCDEALIDVTIRMQRAMREMGSSSLDDHRRLCLDLAEQIRSEMLLASGCVASVGIASNILLARLATKKAKPDGAYFISQQVRSGGEEGCAALLETLPIRDLPGIGWSLESRCNELGLSTCGDLARTPLVALQREFGPKMGAMLHNYSMGQDERVLENKTRQSVSCEINWGIRFTTQTQIDSFLLELSGEVVTRLHRAGMHSAAHVSVTAKKKLYEGEPDKFLGCGHCDDLSRSLVPGRAVDTTEALYQHVAALYREIGVMPTDVRGIGIHLKKLKRCDDQTGRVADKVGAKGVNGRHSRRLGDHCGSDEEEDEEEGGADSFASEDGPQTEHRRRSSQTTLGFQRAAAQTATAAGVISPNKLKSVIDINGSSGRSWFGGAPSSSSGKSGGGCSVARISSYFAQQQQGASTPAAAGLKSQANNLVSNKPPPSIGSAAKRPAGDFFVSAVNKRQQLVVNPGNAGPTAAAAVGDSVKSNNLLLEMYGISDPRSIDPEVLRFLPVEIQRELAAAIRS